MTFCRILDILCVMPFGPQRYDDVPVRTIHSPSVDRIFQPRWFVVVRLLTCIVHVSSNACKMWPGTAVATRYIGSSKGDTAMILPYIKLFPPYKSYRQFPWPATTTRWIDGPSFVSSGAKRFSSLHLVRLHHCTVTTMNPLDPYWHSRSNCVVRTLSSCSGLILPRSCQWTSVVPCHLAS